MNEIVEGAGRMSGGLRAWGESLLLRYEGLMPREQRLVLAAVVLIPMAILIFGIMLPMQDQQRLLLNELASLQKQAEEAEQLAERLAETGPRQSHGGQQENLMAVVERLARQSQVREYMTRIRPQPSASGNGQSLMLQLKDAPYTKAIGFLDAIAREHVTFDSIKIQAGKSSGLVHLQSTIISE